MASGVTLEARSYGGFQVWVVLEPEPGQPGIRRHRIAFATRQDAIRYLQGRGEKFQARGVYTVPKQANLTFL